jgi:hypothetical protein
MKAVRIAFAAWVYFCLATAVLELGLLAALWQRGLLNARTVEHLLLVAYDVPLREQYEDALARAQRTNSELPSHAEVQEARFLAILNLDLREMSADKGLTNLRELDLLVDREKNRYTDMKDDFDQSWAAMGRSASDTALLDLRRQIESVKPSLAKDQLLRILDDDRLEPELALRHVVAIFRGMPVENRKKLITEFTPDELPRLHDILREIRMGMPQASLIREARARLEQFRHEE